MFENVSNELSEISQFYFVMDIVREYCKTLNEEFFEIADEFLKNCSVVVVFKVLAYIRSPTQFGGNFYMKFIESCPKGFDRLKDPEAEELMFNFLQEIFSKTP